MRRVLPMLVAWAAAVAAQPADDAPRIYSYVDDDGVPVFTDRRPASRSFDALELETESEPARVDLYQRVGEDQRIQLVAGNAYYAPVELVFGLVTMHNLAASTPRRGRQVVPARAERPLLTLERADVTQPMEIEYGFRYMLGDPSAHHAPDKPYRLPYAPARAFVVSQAWPDTITHVDDASRHAVDFEMPVGADVYAARAGTVVDVAGDFFDSGTAAGDVARANFVRILHADGTMAVYAHLNWNSIRVTPGERVARGQYLADSGNTGFSTGPHLHFVVQRNAGARLVSVPVRFAGAGGRALELTRGDEPTAY